MWNLKWKARLRRYQPANWDLGKEVSSFLWRSSGAEKGLEKVIDFLFVRGKNAFDKRRSNGSGSNDPAPADDAANTDDPAKKDWDNVAGKTYKTFLSETVNNCFNNLGANNDKGCAVFPFGLVKDPPGQDRNGYKYDEILH